MRSALLATEDQHASPQRGGRDDLIARRINKICRSFIFALNELIVLYLTTRKNPKTAAKSNCDGLP